MLYPLKFKKVFIEKVWGGREFETKLGMTLPKDKKIGESWEISAHPNGMSVIENGFLAGKTLQEVYNEYKGKLVGEKVYSEYKDRFPLLIKYLDVNDRLSIQVHPNDEIAMKNHNELGKSESWYIMEASDDAVLIMGMKPGITKDDFLKKAENNDFKGLFEEKSVKKGDFIDIVPGTVHASLKGSVLFAEIQENSDITYRIYDFDRKVDIINTDFDKNETRKNIIRKKYYSIDKININDSFSDINDKSMIIYSILDGEGLIIQDKDLSDSNMETESQDNCSFNIKKGESILVPPHINVTLKGNFEILRTIIE